MNRFRKLFYLAPINIIINIIITERILFNTRLFERSAVCEKITDYIENKIGVDL